MKLLRERFHLLIGLLFTVLLFAFLISNFPFSEEVVPNQEPVADVRVGNFGEKE
jgi:hypothetical protein